MKGEASPARPDADRRRFLIAGLVAAPLIVTLSARPAFARVDGSLGNYGSETDGVTEPTGFVTTTGF